MPEIVIGEAPGVRITERIRHQGFFFGHRDTDLEQRWLPEAAALDPAHLEWPEGAVVLRVLHHVARVRHVWGEALPAADEAVASARVYAHPAGVRARRDYRRFPQRRLGEAARRRAAGPA